MAFIEFEKTYDRVLREILWKVLEKKGVYIAHIQAIKDRYDGAIKNMITQGGVMEDFAIKINLHQGSS